MGNVIEGRKPALFFQVVEPFPASGIGIGKLESLSLPGIEKVTFYSVAVSVAFHDVIAPLVIFNKGFRPQGDNISPGFVIAGYFHLSP